VKHQPVARLASISVTCSSCTTRNLDEVADSSSIRQEQVRTILREWDGEKVAIVAGDNERRAW